MPLPEKIMDIICRGRSRFNVAGITEPTDPSCSVDARQVSVALRSMDTTRQKLRRWLKTMRNPEKSVSTRRRRGRFLRKLMRWTWERVKLSWSWPNCSHKEKKKTWSQNKVLKGQLRTDRQRHMKRGRRSKQTMDQLKLVTRYGRCGQRGHWHKECTNPDKPRTSPFRSHRCWPLVFSKSWELALTFRRLQMGPH